MSEVSQRIEELVGELNAFSNWEDKYAHIIQCAKLLEPMAENHKVETNLVKGCQSQVWLAADLDGEVGPSEGQLIHFSADSDASIVKGIISILLRVYNNLTPTEVLAVDDSFIDQIGLRQHLSMSRANGLNSMLKQIKLYALAYKTKIEMAKG